MRWCSSTVNEPMKRWASSGWCFFDHAMNWSIRCSSLPVPKMRMRPRRPAAPWPRARRSCSGPAFFASGNLLRSVSHGGNTPPGVREQPLRDGTMHFRVEDAGFVVIDHEQPMHLFFVCRRRCHLRTFEKAAQIHQLVRVGEIFGARRMQDHRLTVARDLQVAVGFVARRDQSLRAGRSHRATAIVRDRMLEDRFVGAAMCAGEGQGRIHRL